MYGEVIGINSNIFSPNREGTSVGYGFAIPSNMVKFVAEQLIENKQVKRGWLGVWMAGLDELRQINELPYQKKLFEEIYLSKRMLELYLDKKINYFAFPFGRYNLNTIELCRNAGYDRVFSTDYGSNIITRNNYCLRRGHIKRDFSIEFIKQKVK